MPAAATAAAAAAAVAAAAAGAAAERSAALPASNMPWESLLKHRPRRLDWLSTKLNELNKVKQINQNNLNNLNKSYFLRNFVPYCLLNIKRYKK